MAHLNDTILFYSNKTPYEVSYVSSEGTEGQVTISLNQDLSIEAVLDRLVTQFARSIEAQVTRVTLGTEVIYHVPSVDTRIQPLVSWLDTHTDLLVETTNSYLTDAYTANGRYVVSISMFNDVDSTLHIGIDEIVNDCSDYVAGCMVKATDALETLKTMLSVNLPHVLGTLVAA